MGLLILVSMCRTATPMLGWVIRAVLSSSLTGPRRGSTSPPESSLHALARLSFVAAEPALRRAAAVRSKSVTDVPLSCLGVLMSKAAVRFFLLVTLLLSLTSCSGSTRVASAGSDSTLATGAPSPENTTAVEQPLPAGGGNPAIKAAPLPVGGNEDGGPCLQVSWSGDAIPDGVGAMITSVVFEPNTYTRADNNCHTTPACINHVLRKSDTQCFLGIMPTDPAATSRDPADPVAVTVNGYVVCVDENAAVCTSFKESVTQQPGSLTVARPIVGGPTPAPQDSATGSGSDATPQSTSASPGG